MKLSLILGLILFPFLTATASNATKNVTLQLKWKHQFQFAGYYAAIEKGYYAEEGLDVTLLEGKPGGQEVEEVISGRSNFGIGMSDILLSRLQGKPVVVLATIFQHSPSILLTTKASGILSPQDLFNRKVMMTPGSKSAELQAIFINEGISLDKIEIVKPSWNLDDLIDGRVAAIAAYISSQPYFLRLKKVPYTVISPSVYGIDFYGDNLFTSEREIKKHPTRVAAFRRASLKGWKYALDHPEEIADLILSRYIDDSNRNITREFLLFEAGAHQKLILPKFVDIGHMNPGRWKHIADTYVKLGMADKDYSLKGFLYGRPYSKFDWSHWSIKLAIALICLGFAIILLLFFFNRRLNIEIDERKKSEDALRESEVRYRALFEKSPDAIFMEDLEDRIIDVNPNACKLMGYNRNELLKMQMSDLQAPEVRGTVGSVRRDKLEKHKSLPFETLNIHKDGTLIPVEVKTVLLTKESLVLSIVHDITERKKAEKETEEKTRLYQILLDAMPCVAMLLRPSTRKIVASNKAAREAGAFPGTTCFGTWGQRKDPCPWCLASKVWRKEGAQHLEIEALDIIWDAHWFPIDEDLYLHYVFDITEKRKLETQLKQAQKMEAIGTLAGGIAHDFNNLLMGMQGRVSLMQVGKDASHPDSEHLQGIEDNVKSAADLTKQLLGFARGGQYEVKPTDLNELLKTSSAMFGRTKKEIKIHKKSQKEIWTVEVDQGQIEQVLLNLYINAWQACPPSRALRQGGRAMSGTGDIYLETENVTLDETYVKPHGVKPGRYVKVSVTDTGIGMDKATRQRVFDPFFTTKEMDRGTGMGLASAYGIIKNHDGIINVYSEKGKGTTFNIYLPSIACAQERQAGLPVTDAESERLSEILRGTETVLLVDDEEMIIDVGKELLCALGYTVFLARSGKEAVEIYKKNKDKIDMVLLDMIMPEMGGSETYDRLKEINPDIKVLLSSGYSLNSQAKDILSRGCDGFIQKPFGLKDLSQKLREILDKE